MGVRPFSADDIPQVANLWWTVLRRRKDPHPPALLSYFQELYFAGPLVDPDMPSLVYEDKSGRIVGFLGVVRRGMTLRGEPLRVAFGGNFVVQPQARSSLGGLFLLKQYMAGIQDLSATDSANDTSKVLLERLGFQTSAPLSIHWARILRPSQYAIYGGSKLMRSNVGKVLRVTSDPVCRVVDNLATRVSFSPLRRTEPRLKATELDLNTLLCCLNCAELDFSIRPEYDSASIAWLLSFMQRMHPQAELRKFVLRDDNGKVAGWYLYYAKRGAIGQVVQIGGPTAFIGDVLDHLFQDAWEQGVAGVHGTVPYRRMAEYSLKNCIFTCQGGWTVIHSRNAELLELLNRGDAAISRLDGEWCLNFDE